MPLFVLALDMGQSLYDIAITPVSCDNIFRISVDIRFQFDFNFRPPVSILTTVQFAINLEDFT